MKTNLKTFPKARGFEKDDMERELWEISRWKISFEKELKEMRDYFKDNFKYLEIVRKAHIEMINDILGESNFTRIEAENNCPRR